MARRDLTRALAAGVVAVALAACSGRDGPDPTVANPTTSTAPVDISQLAGQDRSQVDLTGEGVVVIDPAAGLRYTVPEGWTTVTDPADPAVAAVSTSPASDDQPDMMVVSGPLVPAAGMRGPADDADGQARSLVSHLLRVVHGAVDVSVVDSRPDQRLGLPGWFARAETTADGAPVTGDTLILDGPGGWRQLTVITTGADTSDSIAARDAILDSILDLDS